MTAMGEASVFLLVAIVEPPREVSSGIDILSTGRNGGGGITGGRDRLELLVRRDLEWVERDECVDAVVLEVDVDFAGRMGIAVSVSDGVMKILFPAWTA